jgi:hypothetical protein
MRAGLVQAISEETRDDKLAARRTRMLEVVGLAAQADIAIMGIVAKLLPLERRAYNLDDPDCRAGRDDGSAPRIVRVPLKELGGEPAVTSRPQVGWLIGPQAASPRSQRRSRRCAPLPKSEK